MRNADSGMHTGGRDFAQTEKPTGLDTALSSKCVADKTAYSMYLDDLWKIAGAMEIKLAPMLTDNLPKEDKPAAEVQLLNELSRIVDRFGEINDRIRM